jgi:hypothetical protein
MIAATDDMADPDPRPADAANQPAVDAEPDAADDTSEPSLQDWVEAENSRPTLPDETADGLDDMDEEVRHQAEDLPLDTPGRL